MKILSQVRDFFSFKELRVPENHYVPSDEFVAMVLASQSQGSVSLGDGRINSRETKDQLYESLKDYSFTD
ncbi:MAG: hypothetical protein HOP21_00940 [Methylotenera sp.]|nr:hypothetical protein [Methylotenera sp.]